MSSSCCAFKTTFITASAYMSLVGLATHCTGKNEEEGMARGEGRGSEEGRKLEGGWGRKGERRERKGEKGRVGKR